MTIEELLTGARPAVLPVAWGVDPLVERGALREAQLLAARLDAIRSTAWLLFDCRMALQIDYGNTAILVVAGLRSMAWDGEPLGPRTAWTVGDWIPAIDDGRWTLTAGFIPDGRLLIAGASASCYVGDVPGCDGAPPDYVEDSDATISAGVAGWSSEFTIRSARYAG